MVLAFLKSKPWGLRRKTTGFRFYQQIIILVLLIVTIPLGGLSVWLYDINDGALRKQIAATEEDVLRATLKSSWQEVAFQRVQSQRVLRLFQERRFTPKRLNQQDLAHLLNFEDDLQFMGVCHVKTGELLQWASKVSPNQWQRKGINQWACGILGSELARKEHYELLPAWQSQGKEPAWLQSRLPLNNQLTLVQVRKFNSLQPMLGDLLHLQKAGVWLALPYPTENRSSVLHLKENKEGVISFEVRNPPQAVLDALFQERVNALRVLSQATKKSLFQQAPLPKDLSWKGVRHEGKNYILAELKPLNTWLIVSPDWHQNRHFLKQARLKIFGLIGASLLVSILIGLGYVLGIIRNFRQLIKGIKAMGEGHYGRQIRLIVNWVTPFEIRYLTSEVNRMGRQLEKQVTTIQEANTQLAKLDELKSTLIDTVSHELRTPLMNIQGYTNRLLKHRHTLSEEQQVQSLHTIKQQCKRLNRLVEDLLVIPDLENHRLRVYCEAQSLQSLWQHLLPLLPEAVQDALNVQSPSSDALAQWTLFVDEDRWQQVLVNLLENAAKYRLEESDPIRVCFEQRAQRLYMHISNPSEELSEAQLKQLFEKFHRLDDGLTRRSRGSGLGLFIAKALTEAMEGTLFLSYDEGYFTASVSFLLED